MNEDIVISLAIEFLRNRDFLVEKKLKFGLSQTEIVRILKVKVEGEERDVYQAQDGSYFITYMREDHVISTATVEKMLTEKILVPKWPENPRVRCFILR